MVFVSFAAGNGLDAVETREEKERGSIKKSIDLLTGRKARLGDLLPMT